MELVNGKVYKGFLVVEDGVLERLGVRYWRLKHLASGATLVYTDRDDGQLVFSASFRTLPRTIREYFIFLSIPALTARRISVSRSPL